MRMMFTMEDVVELIEVIQNKEQYFAGLASKSAGCDKINFLNMQSGCTTCHVAVCNKLEEMLKEAKEAQANG